MFACGPLEIRIGAADGAKPLNGEATAPVDTSATSTFQCGDVITAQDNVQTYTVTTAVVAGGCEFTFDQNVEIIAVGDYDVIKDFRNAVHFVNRVEVDIRRLDFFDDKGEKFELDTHIRDLELWVDGEQMLNMEQVRNAPRVVVLAGPALANIKNAVKNREGCTVHVMAKVTLLDSATRSGVRCQYESQPTYVVSTSEL
jgi:hypothetical protein